MFARSIAASIAVIILPGLAQAQDGAANGEWRAYGGDNGGTRYSALSQIDATNVADLEFAWRWVSGTEKGQSAKTGRVARFNRRQNRAIS